MSETIGVWGEPVGCGVMYRGPRGKEAWSPMGFLSSALSAVLERAREVAAHPWDPWPLERGWPPLELRTLARPARAKKGVVPRAR